MKIILKKIFLVLAPRWLNLVTTYRDGTKVSGLNQPGYGGRGLFLFGERQEFELDCLEEFLNSGDVVIDVGANVGAYTMKAASLVGKTGTVVAVEPYPATANRILKNISLNRFNNIRIRVACASDKDGHATFYLKHGKPNSFTLTPFEGCETYDVSSIKLDTLAALEGLEKLALIKIDAEGAENLVLAGAASIINRFKPVIIAEVSISKEFVLPEGYGVYRIPKSHNRILIHDSSWLQNKLQELGLVRV